MTTWVTVVIDGFTFKIDAVDLTLVRAFHWRVNKRGDRVEAVGQKNPNLAYSTERPIRMHRLIMGASARHVLVDHINGDATDNRRQNLRLATKAQNNMNRKARIGASGFKNVCWCRDTKKWRSRVKINGRLVNGRRFGSIEEAARHADELAIKHHGEFANLNFPASESGK